MIANTFLLPSGCGDDDDSAKGGGGPSTATEDDTSTSTDNDTLIVLTCGLLCFFEQRERLSNDQLLTLHYTPK